MTFEPILERLKGLRCTPGKKNCWSALCPAHDDTNPSLSIKIAESGKLLLFCHGQQCSTEEICSAIGISPTELFEDAGMNHNTETKVVATYDYTDEAGAGLFQVVRLHPKSFRQRQQVGGGWQWNLDGVERVPYNLKQIAANPGRTVAIVEGEKSADRLNANGLIATCSPGGGGSWPDRFGKYFTGRTALLLPDNDEPGRSHMQKVKRSLLRHGAKWVRELPLPGLAEKQDVFDWLDAKKENTIAYLKVLAAGVPEINEASLVQRMHDLAADLEAILDGRSHRQED